MKLTFITSIAWLWCCFPLYSTEPLTFRVMTFNLWHGGDAGKQPLAQTVKVIREARADVVGLQETAGLEVNGKRPDNGKKIAEQLGWHHLDQGGNTAIISRFPIVAATKRKWGAKLEPRAGEFVWMFNVHFSPAPYQPYQLLRIPYGNAPFLKDEAGAIQAAKSARGPQVSSLLFEVFDVTDKRMPALLTGDFNEPSHLDWTAAAVDAKKCPIKVEWPTTKAVTDAHFLDAFRQIHADPITTPGITWTPITLPTDSKDHHDRIDFVFIRGPRVSVKSAEVVGENAENAHIVVTPYPSDHRAVVVRVEIAENVK